MCQDLFAERIRQNNSVSLAEGGVRCGILKARRIQSVRGRAAMIESTKPIAMVGTRPMTSPIAGGPKSTESAGCSKKR
jgi:hypothetical protein